jgi:hypothetical protein
MKRSLGVSCVFAAVLLAFALVSGASAQVAPATPDPVLAAVFAGASLPQTDLIPKPTNQCGMTCLGRIHHTSPTISGSGANCTAAQNSLNSQLQSIASNNCVNNLFFDGVCNFVVTDTTSCTFLGGGTYQIMGYATYSCSVINC